VQRSDQNFVWFYKKQKEHLVSSSVLSCLFYNETATPTSSKKLMMTLLGFLLSGIKRQRTRWSMTACRTRGIGSMWPVLKEKKRTVLTSLTRVIHCLEVRKYATHRSIFAYSCQTKQVEENEVRNIQLASSVVGWNNGTPSWMISLLFPLICLLKNMKVSPKYEKINVKHELIVETYEGVTHSWNLYHKVTFQVIK
jgi:hypothetical protein